MRQRRATLWLAGFVIALVGSGAAWAQTELFGLNLSGEAEVGERAFVDRPARRDRARFELYGDRPGGIFLDHLRLGLESKDEGYFTEIRARNAGVNDQNFQLRSSRLGRYAFEFEWDQTPHIFSTTGKLLGSRPTQDVFTLPSPRPALSEHNNGSELDVIGVRWDTARVAVGHTPTPDWDFRTEYTRIDKHGDKPIGMAFGSPGNNHREILEPIQQDVHDVKLSLGTAKARYRFQASYNLSLFRNDFASVTSDNPSRDTDSATAGSSRGRTALPPDNTAHTFTLAGGVALPLRTQLNVAFSYGWRSQNQSFLPHTINSAISDPALTLPQSSLNGDVRTILANLSATSRLLRSVTLTARYRFYRFDDRSDAIKFPAHVLNDRELEIESRLANRFPYDKHNAGVDARWQLLNPLAFTLGVGWERWDRDSRHREAPITDEYMPKAVLDYTPTDWLLLRGTYAPSWRSISRYNPHAHLAHTVEEDDVTFAQSQHVRLRKFDEAIRQRQRFDLLGQVTPIDTLSAGLTYSIRRDAYPDSFFGLKRDEGWAGGLDVTWTPTQRLSFLFSYVREESLAEQRSRQRPITDLENDTFDWVASTRDLIDTLMLGAKTALLPKKLDAGMNWSVSYARSKMAASNPVPPRGAPGDVAGSIASNFPTIRDTFSRLETFFRYYLGERWWMKLGYTFELFRKTDFRTDGITQVVSAGVLGSDIVLGNDIRNYSTHIFAITVGYRF